MRRSLLCRLGATVREVETSGSPLMSPALAESLRLQWRHGFGANSIPKGSNRYTHGFHPYMAGLNPEVVRTLLPVLELQSDATLLDPFAGSGTTLTQAAALGFHARGVDLSPLACFVAYHQSSVGRSTEDLERLVTLSEAVSAEAVSHGGGEGREALRSWGPLGAVLHRLSGDGSVLRSDVAALWFCLSAALGRKLTGAATAEGVFLAAVCEFSRRSAELGSAARAARPNLGAARHSPLIRLGDVRAPGLVAPASSVDGVISSPPYPCVYGRSVLTAFPCESSSL